jgi:monoamine oxidase
VLFAGEHCSVEFQGYMEGAAREGERAAREIVQEVGQELAREAP